jgi:hypothetical protein
MVKVKAMRRALFAAMILAMGCGTAGSRHEPPPPRAALDATAIAALIDPHVKDRAAWGQAVSEALATNHVAADRPSACAVLAVIGQESGFQQDPVVPGLARLVEARLESYRGKLGPLGQPLFARLLSGHAPNDPRPFEERLRRVRTERDLDLVFRDLLAYYQNSHPAAFEAASLAGKLFDFESLADLNPITTAGPMQVSVRFAETWAREHGRNPDVRDSLYTRTGGVTYGTARLFGYQARYPRMIFRFADYNAGVYSSRNAAVQAQVAKLMGTKLALDGDLLRYQKDGRPSDDDSQTLAALRDFRLRYAPALSEDRVRADAEQEKTAAFEETATYKAVKATYAARIGPPEYAVLPAVMLEGPKLSRKLSTAWYAESVNKRFEACLAR